MERERLEECFSHLMEDIACVGGGLKFGEVEAVFVSQDCAGEATLEPLYGDSFVLPQSYMGGGTVTLGMGEVPSEFSVHMVLACVFGGMEDEVHCTWVLGTEYLNLWGFDLQMALMVSPSDVESVPERIVLDSGRVLRVQVTGRRER